MNGKGVAVLLTCYNRKAKTEKCLESLFKILPDCDVFLVDDASTDGTGEMVKTFFPQVNLIMSQGDLFWNRGMHLAWSHAIQAGDYSYYLWLNDDLELYPFFFEELMECNQMCGRHCIVSGFLEDFDKTTILYGGNDENGKKVECNGQPMPIHYLCGNVLLVPSSVVKEIGINDPVLHHDLGDVDYGLTALEHGIPVMSTRRPVGQGYANHFCRVRKWGTSLRNRWHALHSPLGSPPRIMFHFRKKHYGLLNASAYCLFLYFINLLPDRAIVILFGNTYK